MTITACGLDFGTSNSTLGLASGTNARLVALEGTHATIPSAVFYDADEGQAQFGRAAITTYISGADGRLLRALKSVLGTSLMSESTLVRGKPVPFQAIIGHFLRHLKTTAETQHHTTLESVVLGRPVHFIDHDAAADMAAQNTLEAAARAQGFKHIQFQYEPIAAALDYEQTVAAEQVALIIDIGGGTADFSIVRVSPERARAADRSSDILANAGIHIGGTDFDQLFSLSAVMPHLGFKSAHIDGRRDVPTSYYFELSSWPRINRLYTRKTENELAEVAEEAAQPHLIHRLQDVVDNRQGHALAQRVENAKINLSGTREDTIHIPLRRESFPVPVQQQAFIHSITEAVEKIAAKVEETLTQAGLSPQQVQALFLTGGTTQIPAVKQRITRMFPTATVVEGDMFGSVGLGLTLDAARKFA